MRRIISPPPPSSSTEMIPIHAEPIRELWIRRYRLLEKKLEKAKREWRLFEADSLPNYQKWYHSTFWNELNRITEWNEKAREQQKVLMAIVAHQQIYGLDELEAYERVKARLRAKKDAYPEAEDIERYEAKQKERRDAEEKRREAARKKREVEAEKFWASQEEEAAYSEQIKEAFERIFEKDSSSSSAEPIERTPPPLAKKQNDLKTLYRMIVRELHPDTGHEMNPIEKDWWNQAQRAYRAGDLETLKLLALKIQGQGNIVLEKVEQIGTLIDLCTALVEQQDEIDRQRKHLKKDPVYRFWMSRSKQNNRDKLMFELRAQLQHQFRKMRDFVSEVKARLDQLEVMVRYRDQQEDLAEYNPRVRPRAELGGKGRGRGRSRGKNRD